MENGGQQRLENSTSLEVGGWGRQAGASKPVDAKRGPARCQCYSSLVYFFKMQGVCGAWSFAVVVCISASLLSHHATMLTEQAASTPCSWHAHPMPLPDMQVPREWLSSAVSTCAKGHILHAHASERSVDSGAFGGGIFLRTDMPDVEPTLCSCIPFCLAGCRPVHEVPVGMAEGGWLLT